MKNEIIQGRLYKINKKIKTKLIAKYHKIKDWKMDPKGYFLIAVDKNEKFIKVGYCKFTKLGNNPVNDMVAEIKGKTAIELVNMFKNKNIIGAGFIINLPELKGDLKLINKGINIHSLMEF